MRINHAGDLARHLEEQGFPVEHIYSDGTILLRSDAWHMQTEAEAVRDAWLAAKHAKREAIQDEIK